MGWKHKNYICVFVFCFYNVKIRPLWDGNDALYIFYPFLHLQLKSDHCGMETISSFLFLTLKICVKIRPLWDGNDGKYLAVASLYAVKIRPLWDGNNIILDLVLSQPMLKSDHCGIGLYNNDRIT